MMRHGDRPVVMVTGAARRIGLAIARAFAIAGCDLIITYNTSRDHVVAAQATLTDLGARTRLEQVDLNDLVAVEASAQRLAATLDRLDGIVHNASMYAPTPLSDVSSDEALALYRVNALAPLLLTRHLAPLLAQSPLPGGGCVVAMTDVHAMGRPRVGYSAYAMSKAALAEMVRSLARELAPRVRVNGVAPGVVAWPESGREADPDAQAAYLRRVPLARAGTPEDAAETVRWLTLDAHYITGEIIRLDGGRALA